MKKRKHLAVVFGGYVNGYAIVQELSENLVDDIWLVDATRSASWFSNKLSGRSLVQEMPDGYKKILYELSKRFSRLVLYPTNDRQLEILDEIYDDISDFCFIPFNRETLRRDLDKSQQYMACARFGVPYPETLTVVTTDNISSIGRLRFPIIVKPVKRDDLTSNIFRNRILETAVDLEKLRDEISSRLDRGVAFLASEIVPGEDDQIYAYTAYRARDGRILNEWTGKKLSQYPDRFGVFSSASNEAPEVVAQLGRTLVKKMNLYGIVEPEFKFDVRDGLFKLMEINLRSMMWHRVGCKSGVMLQYTQWCDAIGIPSPSQAQEKSKRVHLIYLKHELANLISRKGYWRYFRANISDGDFRHFSLFDRHDLLPSIYDVFVSYPKFLLQACLRRSEIR